MLNRPPGEEAIQRWMIAVVALAFALQFLIIWSVQFPPQHDIPNHMARHFLEGLYLFGDKLPSFYEVEYRVLPNLGGDLVVPFLLRIFEPVVACKIFLSMAVLVYWLGPAMFIWQHGDYEPSAFVASLLLLPLSLSGPFFWGFLNYYTGVGLAFLALVHFNRLSELEHPRVRDLLLHAALVGLLFLWHLAAVVIYGLIMGSRGLADLWQRYKEGATPKACFFRVVLLGSPMLVAFALYAVYSVGNAGLPAVASEWRGWQHKLSLPFFLFRAYDVRADIAVAGLWLAAACALFGFRWWLAGKSYVWLALALITAMSLVMPFSWRSTSGADLRLLPAALTCVLAILGTLPLRHFKLGIALLVSCLVLRYGDLHFAWQRLDARLAEIAPAFEYIPQGSRIMPVNVPAEPAKERPEYHFAAWAVPFGQAYVPTLFAFHDQQPLRLKGSSRIFADVRSGEIVIEEQGTRANYDFVWLSNPERLPVRMPRSFSRKYSSGTFSLWQVPPVAGPRN